MQRKTNVFSLNILVIPLFKFIHSLQAYPRWTEMLFPKLRVHSSWIILHGLNLSQKWKYTKKLILQASLNLLSETYLQ